MTALWHACEQPEREPDPYVLWHHTGCALCTFKADVQIHRFPDDDAVQRILGPIASEVPS